MNRVVRVPCLGNKVKEEASQSLSDTVHVDSSGLVTLTTPSRQHTLSVRAFPLPLGKDSTHSKYVSIHHYTYKYTLQTGHIATDKDPAMHIISVLPFLEERLQTTSITALFPILTLT